MLKIAFLLILFSAAVQAAAVDSVDALAAELDRAQGVERARLARSLAEQLKRVDPQRAIAIAEGGLTQLAQTPEPLTRIQLYNVLASAHLGQANYPESDSYVQQALVLARQTDNRAEQAEALNILGAKSWYQGQYDAAKEFFTQSLAIKQALPSAVGMARAYNNLGVLEEMQGRYNHAIDNYVLALEHATLEGNDAELARTVSNLGVLNQMLKNYDKALHYYERSLALKLALNDLPGAALAHNNISEIHRLEGRHAVAQRHLQDGLGLIENVSAPQQRALLLVNMGTTLLAMNSIDAAVGFFDQSAQANETLNSPRIAMYLAQGRAQAYLARNAAAKALVYAREYQQLAAQENDQQALGKAYYLLYQIHDQLADSAAALSALARHNELQALLYRDENSKYVAYLQEAFDSEKKEKALALLKAENTRHELNVKRQQLIRNVTILSSVIVILSIYLVLRTRATRIKTVLLEQKVQQRTAEIEQQKSTIQSLLGQKETLLQHKNELFSMVSHEFRTPLTLIMGPLETLFEHARNKQVKTALENIRLNGNRLLRMVEQLLDMARLDQKIRYPDETVDVSERVRYLVDSMQTLFVQHRLSLNASFSKATPVDIANEVLEKIVVNLISNAVKYTPEGGAVTVVTENDQESVVIRVADTGIGIAAEDLPRIFDRFSRLPPRHGQHSVEGAGIGLALVKELTEVFSGTVSVTSKVDQGSCFTLRFPRSVKRVDTQLCGEGRMADAVSPVSPICRNEVNTLTTPQLTASNDTLHLSADTQENRATALIVEDNAEMRQFIGNTLAPICQCLFAENGQEGIRLAIQEVPDIIITDLMMPIADGYQLSSVVRGDNATSHIPIIMLTARGDTEARMAAWKSRIDEFIEKPFSARELLLRCKNLLSIRQLLSARLRNQASLPTPEEHPDEAQITERDRRFLQKLNDYLEQHYTDSSINATRMSAALAMTEKQLQRKVKALTEETIPTYVRNFRLKRGAEKLLNEENVTRIALDVGFSSQNYFSTAFAARYGCSPTEYRRAQLGG